MLSQDELRRVMAEKETLCGNFEETLCYLVDDGGFLIASNNPENDYKV